MTDPDMGEWRYQYDPIGSLAAQVDAKEQRTEYAYDKLGRLIRKWHRPSWTEQTITDGTKVSLFDLMELRCAVDANRIATGVLSAGDWAVDPVTGKQEIIAGRDVPIRASHFTDLKDRIQGLWTVAGLGALPEFSAGAITAGSRTVKTSDPLDLRKWLEQYELSNYGVTHRARACYLYDEYDSMTTPTARGGAPRHGTRAATRGSTTISWEGSARPSTPSDAPTIPPCPMGRRLATATVRIAVS